MPTLDLSLTMHVEDKKGHYRNFENHINNPHAQMVPKSSLITTIPFIVFWHQKKEAASKAQLSTSYQDQSEPLSSQTG